MNRFFSVAFCLLALSGSLIMAAAGPVRADDPPPPNNPPLPTSPEKASGNSTSGSSDAPASSKAAPASSKKEGWPGWLDMQGGLFTPVNSAGYASERPWAILQFTVNLLRRENKSAVRPGIFIDTTSSANRYSGTENSHKIYYGRDLNGLGVSERIDIPLFHRAVSVSFGGGAGAYCLTAYHNEDLGYTTTDPYTGPDDPGGTTEAEKYHQDQRSWRGGFKLFADIRSKGGTYIQAGWINAGKMGGRNYMGTTFSIGYRL